MLGDEIAMPNVSGPSSEGVVLQHSLSFQDCHWACTPWKPSVEGRVKTLKSLTGAQILVPSLPVGFDFE